MQSRSFVQQISALWQKMPLHRRGAIAATIPSLCLLLSLGTFTWLRQSTEAAQKQVDQIELTLMQSEELLTTLLNGETGMRGYRITRQREFLEPYDRAMADLPQILDRLEQLTATEGKLQQQQLENIKVLIGRRVEFLRQGVELEPPLPYLPTQRRQEIDLLRQGKIRMDAVRAAIADFEVDEQRRLQVQKSDLQAQQDLTTRVLWVSAGVSALGSFAALCILSQLEQELKERERRLGESKTLIQAITTNVVDGIITLDQTGQVETLNAAAAQMFNYQPAEVLGKTLALLLTDPIAKSTAATSNLWDNPTAYAGSCQETVGFRKDGQPFPVEVSISEMPLERRLIAIIRDITERQQAQKSLAVKAAEMLRLNATLNTTNIMLAARNQELNQFAYIASHDLKAPLRAIANLSVWLEEDLGEQLLPENRQQMDLLRGRVNRMEALINGLLEYSRAGRLETLLETVDVAALLAEVIDALSPPETFAIAVQPKMPKFQARRLLLRQVFANLIDNAIKHSPHANGKVVISATEQETTYTFAVADDGEGIDLRYHDKIFTIFQTLEARDQRESTGIGLSIVRKIIETEGGKIWVESQLSEGATFYFTWLKSPLEKVYSSTNLPPFADLTSESV